ncbi:MAG: hypothetical protein IIW65_00330 [Alistipes sp.]|nr:hypothetical protein [Alistipes sp.]
MRVFQGYSADYFTLLLNQHRDCHVAPLLAMTERECDEIATSLMLLAMTQA